LPFLSLFVTRGVHLPVSFVAVALGLFGVGRVAAAVVGGMVSDRVGRRRMLLAAQAATVATTLALGWAPSRLTVAACAAVRVRHQPVRSGNASHGRRPRSGPPSVPESCESMPARLGADCNIRSEPCSPG